MYVCMYVCMFICIVVSEHLGSDSNSPIESDRKGYIHTYIYIYLKCRDPNLRPDPNDGSEPEPSLLRSFSFILSKTFYLCHFILEFSITRKHFIYNRHKAFLNIAKTVANDRLINIYIYTNTFTLKAFYAPSKRSAKQCF